MIPGPEGDEFRAEGLLVALPALFAGRVPTDQSVAVGIAVDGVMVQLRATDTGVDVERPDGRELDAVLTAEGALVLGLAAGVLSLDDVAALVDIDGDQSALANLLRRAQVLRRLHQVISAMTQFAGADAAKLSG